MVDVFSATSIVDRRVKPSHGYRAVHVIVKVLDKPIEVQIRTELRHQWAEISEKFSDIVDPLIKYGKGDWWDRLSLKLVSEMIKLTEIIERRSSKHLSNKTELQRILLKQIIGMYANTLKLIQYFEKKL